MSYFYHISSVRYIGMSLPLRSHFYVVCIDKTSIFPNICMMYAFTFAVFIKVVRDPCQKITLLLLKSKSVRVIVPESCF